MRGVFVTATDTEVGKTVVAAAIAAALVAEGLTVRAFKPAVTGSTSRSPASRPTTSSWPRSRRSARRGLAASLGPAVSPHLAAELAGQRLEPETLVRSARDRAARCGAHGALVVEGVGGLLVPLAEAFTVRDLAVALALPS